MATRQTFLRLRDKYYWPTMLRDVKEYCTSCEPCVLGRRVYIAKAYINPLDLATRPFEVLGLDFLGLIKPHTLQGNNYILVIMDYFSEWIEVIPITNCTALSTNYKSQIMERLHEAFQLVKINLSQAREQQKAQYDKRVKEQKFNVGDKVLLDMRTPLAGISKKLIPRIIGPFRILKVSNNSTVEKQQDKEEPGVDFLVVRIEKQAEKFVQETADELETSPPPLETNLQSEIEQIPSEKETPTQNLMRPPPTIPPTLNFIISSPTISLPSNPIPEASTIPIQPERHLGLRSWKLLKPVVKF
ncbi:Uncharacterized protein APZ42_031555 [Daphnia magna]|uniref:RNA-directed DNA polymerase n=1 Tax=Daphnia magna TaxID=35525 RepID=A0A164MRQ9_9CRUS|nr:Uncharacterized protein APZ42_031555 [Daphnia magna]